MEVGWSCFEVELSRLQWDGVAVRRLRSLSAFGVQSCEGLKCSGLVAQTIGHRQQQRGLCWPWAQGAPGGTGGEHPARRGRAGPGAREGQRPMGSRSGQVGQGFGAGQRPPLHNWPSSGNPPGAGPGHAHRGLEVAIPSHGPCLAQLRCREGQGRVLEGAINHQSPQSAPGSTV